MGVVTVHKALEESSDVAAVKLALKVGPDKFYQYIRAFGFGSRSGIELPGETRGLLLPVECPPLPPGRPRSYVPRCWGPTSIGSIAIGQEVAVTPVQLVSMVSTIANGGVYLPPHILMPDASPSTDLNQNSAPPQVSARPFKAGGDLPNPLPTGAHRVISTLSAAEMRQMMEGVVLFGTGKKAQLNGYSSGGKTGTAQKIDPSTHTYSKTMHIGSFAGFAPVNNPVISVAIVMDSPKGQYYGADVSAPVFSELAQQVLEYLGVPHDIDLKPAATPAKKSTPINEDDSAAPEENLQALYQAANDLPSDDPQSPSAQKSASAADASSDANPADASPSSASQPPPSSAAAPPAQPSDAAAPSNSAVFQLPENQLRVPSLLGLPVREVIEQAGAAGLVVQVMGNGIARDQAPAPGTMVAPGTKIVVRFAR
jgi:cell division protein FtsI (penicillin-binding protein 3)